MRVMRIVSLILLVGLTATAYGQVPPGMPGMGGAGAMGGVPKEAIPAVESQVIPGDKIGDIALDDVLQYLQDTVPTFNSAVVRSPGTPTDYPMIPQMRLKNVTVGQFLELVKTSFPGVTVNRVDGNVPLYVVSVDKPDAASATASPVFGGPPAFAPPGSVPAQPTAQQKLWQEKYEPRIIVKNGVAINEKQLYADFLKESAALPVPEAPTVVKVYRLSEIVANLNGDPKKNMDDVLSLVQAAMDQTGGDAKRQPVLKLHQPTQTLVFKGTSDQMEVLEQVLDSLKPKESDKVAELRSQLVETKRQAADLNQRSGEAESQARDDREKMKQMESQLMTTQLELEATRNQLNAGAGNDALQRLKDRRAAEAKSATQP